MFNKLKMKMAIALGQMFGRAPASLQRMAADHNRTVEAVAAKPRSYAATAFRRHMGESALRQRMRAAAGRLVGTRWIDRSRMHWGPNGAQERTRRMLQIARGHLTVSNGLVCLPGIRYVGNGRVEAI